MTPDEFMTAARDRVGLDHFGDPHFLVPHQAWCHDLDGPSLNGFGVQFLQRLAVRDLIRRLEIVHCLDTHPEIATVPVPPIVLIVGFTRSGTTLLHNLMHRHPGGRALLRWELMRPIPPPEASTWTTDERIAKVQASIEPLRGGPLEAMHWVDATEPEECPWGFYDGTGLLGRGCFGVMRRWSAFVMDADLHTTFAEYRRLIQLLLWKNPLPDGGFLVLKSPTTCPHLTAFADTFPEARYVMIHRDPYRALVSTCATVDAVCGPLYSAGSPFLDDGHTDRYYLEVISRFASGMMAFSTGRTDVAHVRYADLMADPLGTTVTAITSTGYDAPAPLGEAIGDYLEQQRAGGRATPPTGYHDYGYDHDDVWAQPPVAEYCQRFELSPERTRMVAPV